ncbi:MAG: hypothetical protein NDI63_03715 [Pseudobdellovibrio sp.]|nr:hypothetical protein [Pseudobdellovibrio sp.]
MLSALYLHRKIGSWVKQQRLEKSFDVETAARQLEIEVHRLQEYESGIEPIKGFEFAKMTMLYKMEPQKVILFLNEFRFIKGSLYKK